MRPCLTCYKAWPTDLIELSNKVNGQEKVPEEQMGSTITSPWKYQPEGRRSR